MKKLLFIPLLFLALSVFSQTNPLPKANVYQVQDKLHIKLDDYSDPDTYIMIVNDKQYIIFDEYITEDMVLSLKPRKYKTGKYGLVVMTTTGTGIIEFNLERYDKSKAKY